jgi:hypothetical protein
VIQECPTHTVSEDDPNLPGLFFSFFTILKGVGNLTSGPISTALLKSEAFKGAAGAYGKTNYVGRPPRSSAELVADIYRARSSSSPAS